jgi:hypothetical protein
MIKLEIRCDQVAIVFGLWAISLGMVAVLAAASGTFGLAIVPLGEDFNWIYFLRHDAEFPAPRAFWEVRCAESARSLVVPGG